MTGQSVSELARQSVLYTQESPALIKKGKKSLFIGLPKEVSLQESRIALTPEAVSLLVKNGHEVTLETGAGDSAKFSDNEYSEAGARIVYSPEEVFEADLILKIEPLTEKEISYLKSDQTVISTLKITNLERKYFERLNEKKVTGIAFELIQDKVGGLPIIRAMSEIAGNTVMLVAAELLSSVHNGRGIILGGITGVPPTKVVILGAGTVGEYAARAAHALGAEIKVFDQHIYRLQRIKYTIGQQIYTSIIDSETLMAELSRADVVIGAMRAEDGIAPMVVTEEMVARMKKNSIIIDVSIDQGGCFETSEMTTHKQPTFQKYGVTHYCVPNIASRVAHTASIALSNVFTPFLLKTGTVGGIEEMIFAKQWFTKGVYSYKGSLTNLPIAQRFNLRYKDLGLLIAARM
ncbi:alanine dehydrogenase [Emticicia soli]|uniref:alanine dehydrogenase n=1 Tax=Emticicia soli TaxID=2027878 RepID=A0ABW5J1X8_9BACT